MSAADRDAASAKRSYPATETERAESSDDFALPFQLDDLDLRGRVVRLDKTLDRILTQHAYPPSVSALVGEATLLAALIGQAMKLRGRFSLQARGDGPVSLVAADFVAATASQTAPTLRAYAQFDPERTPETATDPADLMGEGLFAMTIDQGEDMRPYQGLTPLTAGGLKASAEIYFAQSEQIATRFVIAVGRAAAPGQPPQWRAGGVMLQHLAPLGEHVTGVATSGHADGLLRASDIAEMGDHANAWREANLLLDTTEEMELIGPHVRPDQLLFRLFHEVSPRVYPAEALAFGCSCGAEKVSDVLSGYSAETLAEIAEPDGAIHADCQFCGARYSFRADDFISAKAE